MDRILFQFGPLTIYTFGAAIAVGSLTAYLLASREAKRNGLDESSHNGCPVPIYRSYPQTSLAN